MPADPDHIPQKIRDQLFWGSKHIGLFSLTIMPVVSLARLVVVAYQALPLPTIKQTVLEAMARAPHRIGHLPEFYLLDGSVIENALSM
jgi:hypothetical protein